MEDQVDQAVEEAGKQDAPAPQEPKFPTPVDGRIEVTLSTGRKVTLEELNGLAQAQADGCVGVNPVTGAPMVHLIGYYRTAMAIVSLDGAPVHAVAGKPGLDARLKRLRGREADELAVYYGKAFGVQLDETTLKNLFGQNPSSPD